MKTRRETIVGYRKAKEAMENGYEVVSLHGFRGGYPHLFDPESKEVCERIRSDAWGKLRTECYIAHSENLTSKRSKDYFWKLGSAPDATKIVPMPGSEKLADLKQEYTPNDTPKLMLYTFGCNTYAGKLVTIRIPAFSYMYAETVARKMMESVRDHIDIDEGLWLNDEEEYK